MEPRDSIARLQKACFLTGLSIFWVCVGATAAHELDVDRPTLDKAQARFEMQDASASMLNWEGARKGDDAMLDCRDFAGLRVCTLMQGTIDPMTGKPGGWAVRSFACSVDACVWTSR